MKLPWNPCTNSTIVSDVSLVWHTMDDDKWKEVTEEDEKDELAQLLAIVYRDSSGSFLQAVAASALFPISAMINVASVSEIKVKEIEKNSVESVVTDAIECAMRITVPSDLKSVRSKPFLHIWDCGGQPVFLEILPAFLTPRTMFLLLFDASKDFNERWQSIQTVDGQRIFEEEANETTLDLMSNWSSTIHGHLVSYDQRSHALPDYPRLYYIGTRGDGLLTEKERNLTERRYNKLMKERKAKVKEKLYKQMEGKAYLEIVPGTFIVDNTTSGRDKEDPDISKLRQAIINFVQQKLIVKTPVTWVLFRKILLMLIEGNADENEVKKVIDIEEAHAVGAACKIPHDDVPKALLFYHEVGAVLFYPHISGLHNKVIIDPKWFVDTLGKVFTLEGREEDQTRLMISLLREKGILVQPFYAYVWKSIKKYLDPESMMELLVYFRLAAEVHTSQYHNPNVKQYFLPAVLKLYRGDPGTIMSNYRQRATPLHITFKTGFVPPGYFTRLVTTLASKSSFKLEFRHGIYRNRVTFLYGNPPDLLTLTDISYALQVDVLQCAPDMASFNGVCLKLKAVLKESSDAVEETLAAHRGILSPGLSPLKVTGEFQFICNGCVGGDHYINEYGSFVDCEKKYNAYRPHTEQESFWFERDVTVSIILYVWCFKFVFVIEIFNTISTNSKYNWPLPS